MKLLETLKSLTFFPTLIQGPVHTNPFSNENGAALPRIRLSSTLQRRKRSPKTEPFENALQSGAIWKRCFLKTLFSNVDEENDAIWKRWRHQNRHDRAPDHSTMTIQNGGQTLPCGFNFAPISRADILKCACVEFIWACTLRVWKRFQNGYGVVVCTGENDTKTTSVDVIHFENGTKQFRLFSFENGLVWTGPELIEFRRWENAGCLYMC